MTVCIAASYSVRPNGQEGIAVANDWQITDTVTGIASETGNKVAYFRPHIIALGDDIDLFHGVIAKARSRLEGDENVTVERVADAYLEAEADMRLEYLQREVLTKQGLTWESFFDKLAEDKLPQTYVDNIQRLLDEHPVPYATEAIIAGTDLIGAGRKARIFRLRPHHPKDDFTERGYACIGEGDLIADAEFKAARFEKFWPKAAVLFLTFVAKRRSEVVNSVGRETSLRIMNSEEAQFDLVSKGVHGAFEEAYDELRREMRNSEIAFYDKAKTIFEEKQVERW